MWSIILDVFLLRQEPWYFICAKSSKHRHAELSSGSPASIKNTSYLYGRRRRHNIIFFLFRGRSKWIERNVPSLSSLAIAWYFDCLCLCLNSRLSKAIVTLVVYARKWHGVHQDISRPPVKQFWQWYLYAFYFRGRNKSYICIDGNACKETSANKRWVRYAFKCFG